MPGISRPAEEITSFSSRTLLQRIGTVREVHESILVGEATNLRMPAAAASMCTNIS